MKIFVSYTHDSVEHSRSVLMLSNHLRGIGFDCDIDQYHVNQRWPQWMEERIEWADNVLVVCTETYLKRWKNQEVPGVGLGAQWESLLTRQYLYESPEVNDKFVPVVFEQSELRFIPKPLADVTRVVVGKDFSMLESLSNRLLRISPAQKPPLRTSLSPIALAEGFFFHPVPQDEVPITQFDPEAIGLHQEPEEIGSNMFPVFIPNQIHTAKITLKRGTRFDDRVGSIWNKLGCQGTAPTDYLIDYSQLYSFNAFEGVLWNELIRTKVIKCTDPLPSDKWTRSNVLGDQNKLIKLLNRCLRHLCENNGTPYQITHSHKMRCHLFAAKSGQPEGKLRAFALKSAATRTVYKAIYDKKQPNTNLIQHWQHEAFRHKFIRYSDQWFFVLTPFWAFTGDGSSDPSKWQKKSSSNMRKPERNRAVVGHVMFWASVLCQEPDMLNSARGFRIMRPTVLSISPSIRDSDWMTIADKNERNELQADMDVLL